MALQYIVTGRVRGVRSDFHRLDEFIEVFEIGEQEVGVSIASKVIDTHGEKPILKILRRYKYFDLWSGVSYQPSWWKRFLGG